MNCYLCQSDKKERVEGKVRDIPDLSILRCSDCGLVFLESFDHISDTFYEEAKMRESDPNKPMLEWEKVLNECCADDQRRAEYVVADIKNKDILDFGCGGGGFLLKVKDLAGTSAGVEKDRNFRMILQDQQKLRVFSDLEEIKGAYDYITLFHVIEHLADPIMILKRLSNFLKPSGSILIETPNADDALLSLYKNKPFSEFTYWGPHLFLFNNKTLAKIFEMAGLKINYIKQIQRYPLANHLYWLAKGKPGGHNVWDFFNDNVLNKAYESQLTKLGKCDTLIASISREI